MIQRIEVINYLTGLFSQLVPESFYLKNKKKTVVYPYLTFSLTGEPIRFTGQGFYIDMDIFDNTPNSDVAIEKAVSAIVEHFNQQEPFFEMTEQFLVQIEYRTDNPVPTGSDTLQRRTLQLYAKFDWRI